MEAFAAPDAERHYVGKRGLQKSFKQTQIDALLVELCTQVMPRAHMRCMRWGVCLEGESSTRCCGAKRKSSNNGYTPLY